jgi:hypothetical protein
MGYNNVIVTSNTVNEINHSNTKSDVHVCHVRYDIHSIRILLSICHIDDVHLIFILVHMTLSLITLNAMNAISHGLNTKATLMSDSLSIGTVSITNGSALPLACQGNIPYMQMFQ